MLVKMFVLCFIKNVFGNLKTKRFGVELCIKTAKIASDTDSWLRPSFDVQVRRLKVDSRLEHSPELDKTFPRLCSLIMMYCVWCIFFFFVTHNVVSSCYSNYMEVQLTGRVAYLHCNPRTLGVDSFGQKRYS
jgi:hypothetical protein